MRRGSKRGNHHPQRGRGGFATRASAPRPNNRESVPANPPPEKAATRISARDRFGKSEAMGTAKSIMYSARQRFRRAEDEEFLGSPPPNLDLIECRLVLPGMHMLPAGLDEPGVLDDIRKIYKVYITNAKPNVLSIRAKHTNGLQQALGAINWAIHDMRLSNDYPPTQFFVQESIDKGKNSTVRVDIGSRPFSTSRNFVAAGNLSAMDDHMPGLVTDLMSSGDTLMSLNKNMEMRVRFGRINIRSRNTRGRDEIPYNEFVNMMSLYSHRGGASLETRQVSPVSGFLTLYLTFGRLLDIEKAEQVIQYLVNPERGICAGNHSMAHNYKITMAAKGQEVKAIAASPISRRLQLSMVHAIKPETWARLNWTVAAPDMQYDWNLRVDAWDDADTPEGLGDIHRKLQLTVDEDSSKILRTPRLDMQKLGALQNHIDQLKVKTSVIVPYKASPYVIEVSITETWKGVNTADKPEASWGIELYASHWDQAINRANGYGRRKDWGQEYKDIWPGDDPSLEIRFGDFIRTILEVQALLEEAHAHMDSPRKAN